MSPPLEHDYIGLSESSSSPSPKERSSDKTHQLPSPVSTKTSLKTELRLGLPGSESPEREPGNGVSLFGSGLEDNNPSGYSLGALKSPPVSGSKRGFFDAIDGAKKWDLCMNGGYEAVMGKSDGLVSPMGGSGGSKANTNGSAMKDMISPPAKPARDKTTSSAAREHGGSPASKAQVVGWPPVRSFRKNTLANNVSKSNGDDGKSGKGCLYVKVSMDGAPYLRKVDLRICCNYSELSSALQKMFSCFTIGQCHPNGLRKQEELNENHVKDLLHVSEYVLTYEDKDGDWMLVGDVPWEMFIDSCKRLRIMKGSEAIGLAPRLCKGPKN